MLSKDSIEALARAAGITVKEITEAIEHKEEQSIAVKTKKTFTEEEWEKYEDNIDSEKKAKFDEGKETGQRQIIRDMKTQANLDYEGSKDPKKFIEELTKKAVKDAGANPDKKIQELQKDVEKLRADIKTKDETITTLKTEKDRISVRDSIYKYLPDKLPTGLTKEDAVMLLQNSHEFLVEEGKEVVKKNGEILKTKTRENVSFADAISDIVVEKGWTSSGTGGRGKGDEGSGGGVTDPKKIRKMSEMEDYFSEKGIHPMSQEAMSMIQEAEKSAFDSKEEFDYSS